MTDLNITNEVFVPNKSNLNSLKPLGLMSLQEIQETEKHVKSHHRDAVRKIKNAGNYRTYDPVSSI